MRPSRLTLPLCLLALTASPAFATRTIVPDQHATIQLGIDSGVDTVIVKPGDYPEVVTTDRGVVVMGEVPIEAGGYLHFERPSILGFSANVPSGGSTGLELHDLRFRSAVTLGVPSGDDHLVRSCRFEGTLTIQGQGNGYAHVQNSIVFGDLYFNCYSGDLRMNTIVGGGMFVRVTGATAVNDNVVIGPASNGIDANCDASLRNNYVRDCVTGIRGCSDGDWDVEGNTVEDCSGNGFAFGSHAATMRNNIARRCGGRGFELVAGWAISGNSAEDSGAEGFHITLGPYGILLATVVDNTVLRSGGTGISIETSADAVSDNRVLHANGDALVVGRANVLSGNVVGRSAGRGIVAAGPENGHLGLHRNTSFLNAGAGFDLVGSPASTDSVTNNLSYGNAVGLAWSGPSSPFLGCNDWFANTGAAVTGTSVGATDVAVDPMFCDLPNDIVSFAAGSPLANLAGCGQVGALGVACAVAVGIGDSRPASLGRLRIQPQPSQGAMSFAFEASESATTLEVYDVSGARRMTRSLAPRTAGYTWNGADDAGQPLPAGVYFAKLVQSAARSEATVVVIR